MRWTSVWVGLRRLVVLVLKNHYRYRVSFNKRFQYATSTSTHQPSKRMKYEEEREPVTVLPSALPLVCTQSKQFTSSPCPRQGKFPSSLVFVIVLANKCPLPMMSGALSGVALMMSGVADDEWSAS